MAKLIDINCDLGEGYHNDELLMPYISSCSIACGGHFGDKETMLATVRLAKKNQVKIGAHPSFPDKDNFGRQLMKMDDYELQESIYSQVMSLKQICNEEGVELHHIKLHGALYNLAAKRAGTAQLIVAALLRTNLRCKLYVPYQSELTKVDQKQFEICNEAFIDRSYHSDLSLVNRSDENALISSPKLAWEQLYGIVKHQEVLSVEGVKATILADTFCIHGDQENAVEIMDYIYNQLHQKDLKIR